MLAHKEVAQFPNAHMIASIMKLFFGWFPVENKVTLPSPTPREKKICPAASIHTTGSLSLSHWEYSKKIIYVLLLLRFKERRFTINNQPNQHNWIWEGASYLHYLAFSLFDFIAITYGFVLFSLLQIFCERKIKFHMEDQGLILLKSVSKRVLTGQVLQIKANVILKLEVTYLRDEKPCKSLSPAVMMYADKEKCNETDND